MFFVLFCFNHNVYCRSNMPKWQILKVVQQNVNIFLKILFLGNILVLWEKLVLHEQNMNTLKKILSLGNVLVLWEKFSLSLYFLDRPTSLLKENWGFTDILKHTWDLVYYNSYGGMTIFCGRSWKLWQIQKGQTTHLCTFDCHFISDSGGSLFCFCSVFLCRISQCLYCHTWAKKCTSWIYWFEQTRLHQRFRLDQQSIP